MDDLDQVVLCRDHCLDRLVAAGDLYVVGVPAFFRSPPGERVISLCVATAPQERRERRSRPDVCVVVAS
jgi:hypothetical protein